MQVLRVSVGTPTTIEFSGKTVTTSIFKRPLVGPVQVSMLNLQGDQQSDLSVHGGRDKAVYVYSADYADDWQRTLQVDQLEDSQFGENLTVSACRDEDVVIGSRCRIGTAEFVVTQARIPCHKLGIRLGDESFPNRFWTAGRLGFYLRVEVEGELQTGDAITVLEQPEHGITVRDLWSIVTGSRPADAARAADCLPYLDSGWQRRLRLAANTVG